MKNKTNLIKRIRNIIVGNTLPANEDLWLDTSEGEKKGVLKYKGNPIVGGGGSSGYSSTKQTVTLFNDTIKTKESYGVYQGVVENIDFVIVAGETYTVVFDGVFYDIEAVTSPVPVEEGEVQVSIGELNGLMPSFETYPFYIMYNLMDGEQTLLLLSEAEGSHTVEIKHEEETVTTTPEFKSAVDSVTGYSIGEESETLYEGTVETADSEGYISGIITPTITFVEGDTYKVTFNGTEYNCKCFNDDGYLTIGTQFTGETFDWSTYPFNIVTYDIEGGQYETSLTTNQEGSYTLKIEHFGTISKTTPEFVSMIQDIAGSGDGCKIIYPDSISWIDTLYSQYNKAPEAGNIYFIPFADSGSTNGTYLYPVYIITLTNDDNEFSGFATIIGTPIIVNNGTLTVLDFDGAINSRGNDTKGLCIAYNASNNHYRLYYGDM